MSNLWISEEYYEVNNDEMKTSFLGETEPFETQYTTLEDLFEGLQQNNGECIGKLYEDEEETQQTGWAFEKKEAYEDSPKEFFMRQTLVRVYAEKPVKHVTVTWDIVEAFPGK